MFKVNKCEIAVVISGLLLLYLVYSYKGCHTSVALSWKNGFTFKLCSTDKIDEHETSSVKDIHNIHQENKGKLVVADHHLPRSKGDELPFEKALSKYCDTEKTIVLSLMDTGTVALAINLYLTSYQRFNIKNYLFITSDKKSCPSLADEHPDIHCFQYINDTDGLVASTFGSKAFVRKTHYKTQAVLEAVRLGFNVLLSDIDIVMFQNPFPYLRQCAQCDFQVSWDHNMICSGFFFVRATAWGLKLMEDVWNLTVSKQMKLNDQKYFSEVFNRLKTDSSFQKKILPEHQFLNGNEYFNQRRIMFATDAEYPPKLHFVHSNWIKTLAAKVYRFKENLMWMNDENGYYSNKNAKYLQYGQGTKELTIAEELDVLKAALFLGHVLERIVILPTFTCRNCDTKKFGACLVESGRCTFQTHFKVEVFDKHLKDLYREHVFLINPLVPESIKKSLSKPAVVIRADTRNISKPKDNANVDLSKIETITAKDIKECFSTYNNQSVLVVDNLYGVFSKLSISDPIFAKFSVKLKAAFKNSTYLQG